MDGSCTALPSSHEVQVHSDTPPLAECGSGCDASRQGVLCGVLYFFNLCLNLFLKAEDRRPVTAECPWCSNKGRRSALRSYAVNFKESITLCSSPLCLFALVSRPLEDICASLASTEDTKVYKRKSHLTDSKNPSRKHQKKEEFGIVPEDIDCTVTTEPIEEKLFTNGQEEQRVVENVVKNTCTEASAANNEDQALSDAALDENCISSTQDMTGEMPMDVEVQDLGEMVPTLLHLFWRNKDNLCWLDSLLVALVNFVFNRAPHDSASLTDNFPIKNCTVKNFCARYRKICTYLKSKEKSSQGERVVKVPLDVLHKAEQELEALQLSVFQVLQPKLQCELGQKETPVFALPLLLKTDEWAQSFFQHRGQWEFTCTFCGYSLNTSVEKSVTTFTQLFTDWHPLKAVHKAQCSNCRNKNQKRKLVFQRLSVVLALHFVEGLPRRDVSRYSFDFQGTHYDIRTIIQYNEQLEHFVTWVKQDDGFWLEFDDLKYPHYIKHKRFALRASQFHLVFWEAESSKVSQVLERIHEKCTTIGEKGNGSICFEDMADSVASDSCIIDALTTKQNMNEAVSRLDSSIGSKTLLDTFEGLSHTDIVTLTLVEVKVEDEKKPVPKRQETVGEAVKSSVNELPAPQAKTTIFQGPSFPKHNTNDAKDVSSAPTAPERIHSSTVKTPASEPQQVGQHPHATAPAKPSVSNQSHLIQQYPSHNSTPLKLPCPVSQPRPYVVCGVNDAMPAKPAELFGGFRAKNSPNPLLPDVSRQPLVKDSKPTAALCGTTLEILKSTSKKTQKAPLTTDALRIKLMKKLKAKKKKLEKLNQMLGKCERQSNTIPDSTDLTSPHSVTSSTSVYSSPAYDLFFADILSPAINSNNHSPDSTGLLETITNNQGGETSDSSPTEKLAIYKADFSASVLPEPPANLSSNNDYFLDEFISGSEVQQSAVENTDFNSLDMFF